MAQRNSTFIEQNTNNLGLITRVEPEHIADGAASSLLNIDIDGVGFGSRKGKLKLGDTPSTLGGGLGLFNYKLGSGSERLIWVANDTGNSKAIMRVYDSTNSVWEVLRDNLVVSAKWTFAPFNESGNERVYMCNGYDDIYKWNGATTLINGGLAGSEATITVDSTAGFDESGTLVLEGTDVAYTGKTGTTFTGCTGTPAAADNSMIMQASASTATTIDAMDATTGWASVGAGTDVTIATDSANKREGTNSVKFTIDAAGDTEVEKTISSTDMSLKKVSFWLRCDVAGSAFRFRLGDGTNSNYYNINANLTANTWEIITIDPTAPDSNSGSAATLTAITRIGFDQLDASANYWIDYIRLGNLPAKILLEHNGKIFKAGHPLAPTLLEYSVTGTPENFTTTTGVTAAGAEDFPEGGGEITALKSKTDELLIFKQDIVKKYRLEINDSNNALIPFLDTVVEAPNIGTTNAFGIVGGDNSVYYSSKKDGLRSLIQTQALNKELIDINQITENIRPTIENFDFTTAACAFWENKALMSCKDDGSSNNDIVIAYHTINRALSLYRGWNVGMWAIYNNKLYFADSTSPNVFQAFFGNSDDGGAIGSSWVSKRFSWGERFKKKSFAYIAVDGLISEATSLTIRVNYDDGGVLGSVEGIITGDPDNEYVFAPASNTFGEDLYGNGLFGGSPADLDMNRFRVFCTLPVSFSPYNTEIQFSSNGAGQNWKILSYAFNPRLHEEIPSNLKIALTQ